MDKVTPDATRKDELPLSGVHILDLTQALAGPFASMILADLGASVVKVEPPSGDMTRTTPPHYIDGDSLYFLSHNRNKRGIVIDLKTTAGRTVFYDLVLKFADVVFYNYGPGVVERLKIDHDTLRSIDPRIITCDISGFGRHGPDAERRAVDLIVQAMAGGLSITGPAGGQPVKAGVATADLSAGLYAAIGILAALHARDISGRGSAVETSLFHSQLSLLCYVGSYYLYSHDVPKPLGTGHVGTVPSQVFATRDGYIAVDAGFNKHFRDLCDAIGTPETADDARFVNRLARHEHRDALIPLLQARFATRTTSDWTSVLDRVGVPCGPLNNVGQALSSPQATEYQAVESLQYGSHPFEVLGTPIWFSGGGRAPTVAPPHLGQHTAEVLSEVLGYTSERIEQLAAQGAIGVGSNRS